MPGVLKPAAAYVALGLGLGAVAGVAWEAVVDLPTYTVNADGGAATSERGLTAVVGGDAWFCLLGAVAGLLLGVLAWRRLRRLGWPVVLVGTLTALAAALVCWWVGTALGPGDFNPRLAAAQAGDVVPVALELRAPASLLVWPFLAVVPILLGPRSAATTTSATSHLDGRSRHRPPSTEADDQHEGAFRTPARSAAPEGAEHAARRVPGADAPRLASVRLRAASSQGEPVPDHPLMTAAVMHAPGDIRVEEVPVPAPGPGEVLLRVAACGVCGSDIPRMLRNGGYVMPIICGHEFSAHVEALGEGVTGFAPGDLVSVPPLIPCRHCDFCVRGDFGLCEDYDYFGSRSDGAYAQYVTSPVGNLLAMPAGLDPRAAAMLDPAAIALHALWKTGLRTGHRVLVVGAGPIGLFAVQWARLAGASQVVTIDLSEQKAAMALEAGATHAVQTPAEAAELAGRGFDVVLESAGVAVTADLAASLVGPRGHAVFVGIPHAPVELSKETWNRFLRLEVSLHGSWNSFSAPFPGDEWRTAAAKLASGELKWEFMITHELPLAALPEMMSTLGARSEHTSKVIFVPNPS